MSALFEAAAQLSRQLTQDWHADVERRIRAADDDTYGYMVTREGRARGVTAWDLFTGPASRTRYATRELQDHWRAHPRITRARFERDWITTTHHDAETMILAAAYTPED